MKPAGNSCLDNRLTCASIALKDLRHVADYIQPSQFPQLARKIRSAIKSADGARRHAERMHQQEQRHVARTR